jgi:hypothetical protein
MFHNRVLDYLQDASIQYMILWLIVRFSVPCYADVLLCSVEANMELSDTGSTDTEVDITDIFKILGAKPKANICLTKGDNVWLSFEGRAISDTRLKLVWDYFTPSKPIPNIQCYILSHEEFAKFIQSIRKIVPISSGDIWEYGRQLSLYEIGGCSFPTDKTKCNFMIFGIVLI